LASVLNLMELDLAVPDHTTLSRRAGTWRSANRRDGRSPPRKGTVHVLIDSTGLEVYGSGHWLEDKHGAKSRRGWRKLHLALDADSGEIIAHVMTDQDAGDASQVEPLLDQIDGLIGQFTADGPMMATRPMMPSSSTAPMLLSSFHRGPTRSTAQAKGPTASETGT
jgi:hypothetical protein